LKDSFETLLLLHLKLF